MVFIYYSFSMSFIPDKACCHLPDSEDQNQECPVHEWRLPHLIVQLFQDKPLRGVIAERSTAQKRTVYQLPKNNTRAISFMIDTKAYIMTELRIFQQVQRYQRGDYVKTKTNNLQDQSIRNFISNFLFLFSYFLFARQFIRCHLHNLYMLAANWNYLRYICALCLNRIWWKIDLQYSILPNKNHLEVNNTLSNASNY
jgi:hypothetical protein